MAVRASETPTVGGTESHRGPERDRGRSSKSQLEPEGARVGVKKSHREPERDRERASESQRAADRA